MAEILLTVSGIIDPDIEEQIALGERPQADYVAMASRFDADLIDYARASRTTGRVGRMLERLGGPNLMLAWACFRERHRYDVVFTDGEQVGIPLALFHSLPGRRNQHLMITHVISVGKKMLFLDLFRVHRRIDRFVVYSSWQKRFIEERWHVDGDRVRFTPFMVDGDFFAPERVTPSPRQAICSVGLEFRDYPTLISAVRDMPIDVVIAAASPWSKRRDSTQKEEIPANVTVQRFSQYDLRQLYADCLFVVVPLYDVNFQAGVTTILEAMAMGKAVICTHTPGQTDIVVDGVTGVYVPPGDAGALRQAIQYLLDNPQAASEMGRAGRRAVVNELSLDCYTKRLHRIIEELQLRPNDSGRVTSQLPAKPMLGKEEYSER